MVDDWSLVDKEVKAIAVNHTDGTSVLVNFPDMIRFYSKKDIDILRQKLIDDIKKAYSYEFEDKSDGVIKIINKRFGVE